MMQLVMGLKVTMKGPPPCQEVILEEIRIKFHQKEISNYWIHVIWWEQARSFQ